MKVLERGTLVNSNGAPAIVVGTSLPSGMVRLARNNTKWVDYGNPDNLAVVSDTHANKDLTDKQLLDILNLV